MLFVRSLSNVSHQEADIKIHPAQQLPARVSTAQREGKRGSRKGKYCCYNQISSCIIPHKVNLPRPKQLAERTNRSLPNI